MVSIFRTGIVAGLLFAGLAGTAAADSRIDCPLQQARRTITGNMANGWWTTPVVDRLSQTKIMNIGGKATLVCVYGNAGSVMREAPGGQQCQAVTGGFKCSGGKAPAPTVQINPQILKPVPQQPAPQQPGTVSAGSMKVRLSQTFDLDRGIIGKGAVAEIWLEAKTKTDVYLTPRNGVTLSVTGGRERGRAGCGKVRYSSGKVPLAKLQTGYYICVKTNEGRISEFRITGKSGGVLSLTYKTWN
ncbi:MAG: hypothetical protein OEZ03_17005 [Alphaproteobacteria bacterium]|nr:hypothetical protein [Alphaproteobacteria bacterium]